VETVAPVESFPTQDLYRPDGMHRAGRSRWIRLVNRGWPRRRWTKLVAFGLIPLLCAILVLLTVPVPFVNSYLTSLVVRRVAAQLACPGTLARPPTVTIGGGAVLPQILGGRLAEIHLSVPDLAVGGARHAGFTATLRDVRQQGAGTTQVGHLDAAITIGFTDVPANVGDPPTTYARAEDGSLAVTTVSPAQDATNVTAKLFLKMELRGQSVATVPQRLEIFGRTLPAEQVSVLTGGVRTQPLPALPDGVSYQSVTPQPDGVHVSLGGVATQPLNTLPTQVSGRTVSYQAKDGLLGISTSVGVPPVVNVPLTIFTAPRLTGETLTLVPQSVRILGADRPPSDPLAKLVLGQINQSSLTRKLPALPAGVRYRSVSVDTGGIKVVVGGVAVTPFSALSSGDNRPTTFGAEDGLLTATTRGGNPDGSPTPIVLYARPRITGDTLDIAPQQIEMFGIRFAAADVLAQVRSRPTAHRLQALPANVAYRTVEVLPTGLKITLSGTNVTMHQGQLTGRSC
jgi:DUF2993 family protein